MGKMEGIRGRIDPLDPQMSVAKAFHHFIKPALDFLVFLCLMLCITPTFCLFSQFAEDIQN